MSRIGIDNRIKQRLIEVGRLRKLFLAVIRGLLAERIVLHHLSLDRAVHIAELVAFGQLSFKEIIHAGNDLAEERLLLLLDFAAARFRYAFKFGALPFGQWQAPLPLILQSVMGEGHLREIN